MNPRGNTASVASGDGGSAVRVVPLRRCLLPLLLALLPWLLVVVGRAICLTAQRVPPVVRLVRRLLRERGDRAVEPTTCPASARPADRHAIPPQVRRRPHSRSEPGHEHTHAARLVEHAEHR